MAALIFRAFHVCCGITDFSCLNVLLVLARGHTRCAQLEALALWQTSSPSLRRPDVSVPPALNTGGLSLCIPLGPPSLQSCDSAHCHCSTTATFFSSCWSPGGPAPRRTGRTLPARGSPSPSRHTGTTPCFPYESHTQLCPLLLVLPPPGS